MRKPYDTKTFVMFDVEFGWFDSQVQHPSDVYNHTPHYGNTYLKVFFEYFLLFAIVN